jgi:hypothetical protein
MIETQAQGISSFMKWAERKIAEEVEANEAFEKLTGERAVLEESTHLPHSLTTDQKRSMIDAVDDLRRAGVSAKIGCNEVGYPNTNDFPTCSACNGTGIVLDD